MSLLHQNPLQERDEAAQGEDLAKGSSHLVAATIIAAVLVSAAIGAYFLVGRHSVLATGEVVEVWTHPQHTITPGFDANGEPIKQETTDHVLLFAHVRLHNVNDKPLFLYRISANATLPDGVHTSYAAPKVDYERVFLAYPEIARFRGEGLALDTTLEPGQTADGNFVTSFQVSREEWEARKDLNFTFHFRYQPDLVLKVNSAVGVR